MNNTKMLVAVLVFSTSSIATHATAGPCDNGIALVNPLTNQIDINGIEIDGSIFDAKVGIVGNNGFLPVEQVGISETGTINPSNRFNPSAAQVELDCVIFNENTYRATLNVVQNISSTKLQIANVRNVFDVDRTQDWTFDFSNDFPNEPVMLKTLHRATIPGALGNFEIIEDQITLNFSLNDSTSIFNGTVSVGGFGGPFNHRDQNGTFVATPSNPGQIANLNNGRFQVEIDWENESESGQANAILATDDSAAFYFFDNTNVDTLVRVLDGCNINERFWVFAGGITGVEYTLTVTDTDTGTVNRFNNPLGTVAPAITDTSAFATCP